MPEISIEDRFLFDLQGFLFLPGVLQTDECGAMLSAIERIKTRFAAQPEEAREGLAPAFDTRTANHIRFNGLFRMDAAFDGLIDHPRVLPFLQEFVADPILGNAWMIEKSPGADTGVWHRGIGPLDYSCRGDVIRSRMLNVVFFLTDNGPNDGCVVAIPGSHKNNIELDWEKYKNLQMPGAAAVTGKAGDAFIFSEATVHNGLPKTTPGARANLYFNYAARDFNVMTYDPTDAYHRHYAMPPSVRSRWTPTQKHLTRWMEFAQAEE